MTDRARVDAVARCLAKLDDTFVASAAWEAALGDMYRARAEAVLCTVDNFDAGIQSGGLPPRR